MVKQRSESNIVEGCGELTMGLARSVERREAGRLGLGEARRPTRGWIEAQEAKELGRPWSTQALETRCSHPRSRGRRRRT